MTERRLAWITRLGPKLLPFSDVATDALPLGRLLRLSLFQVSCGMTTVMLLGTLNRVSIVELGVPAILIAAMVALPVLIAPFRALLGFRSDHHRSAIGWRRIPYLWFGSLLQFGGLAIMPFALLVLSGDQMVGPSWAGEALAAIAFLLAGLGLHTTQTAGLALAADQADEETRPRVVALLYVMFLVGMGVSGIILGGLLADFSKLRLVQVVQGTALATLLLNLIALWRQESVRPMSRAERAAPRPSFRAAWRDFMSGGEAGRLLAVVAIGTAAFSMQDVLLEPYGGEILGLSVGATTLLTAIWALGALGGFGLAARWLAADRDPYVLATRGAVIGVVGFAAVIVSDPAGWAALFFAGAAVIGLGAGLFAVSTLTAAMTMPAGAGAGRGLALGAWGAAQATAAGLGVLIGGALRDVIGHAAQAGAFGAMLNHPSVGYSFVYHLEIALLVATIFVLTPFLRAPPRRSRADAREKFGLAEFPT